MTTNGQLNDTHSYHIKPTNSTCNMISCFRLKGPCQRSQISIIVEKYFDKYIKTNVRQNPCCVGSLLQYNIPSK